MVNVFAARLDTDRVVPLLTSQNIETGHTFRTFLVRFPKILLQELNTHRMLVRNCGSSRAIPTSTLLRRIKDDPYVPQFTALQSGMVGGKLEDSVVNDAHSLWIDAANSMQTYAMELMNMSVHKQDANRLLEPFLHVDLILSGTEWDNFLKLRCAPDSQPAFKAIADKIKHYVDTDKGVLISPGDWHIPFKDTFYEGLTFEQNIKVCIARIARVSYLRYGAEDIELEKDIELAERLLASGHLSPLEHVAKAVSNPRLHVKHSDTNASPLLEHSYLGIDPSLHKYLFWDNDSKFYRWTRNYASFYTYRSHLEDGIAVN